MSDRQPQSALREIRQHFTTPATLVALMGVAAILALAGPFGTDTRLRLAPRFVYWLVTALTTYAIGYISARSVTRLLGHRLTATGDAIAASLLTGAGVTLAILVINLATFGYWPSGDALLPFAGTVFAIAAIITLVMRSLEQHLRPVSAPTEQPAPPAILQRLPLDKRGDLVALSVEDHYVRIRTDKGEEMVLMRLADAIREVGETPGLQVHRSHWAATAQVRAARREGDRAILTMRHGPEIPVSRANVPAIREAGLLPR